MDLRDSEMHLPYPSLAGLKRNRRQCELIFGAYSGKDSELTAITQYVYHELIFESLGYSDIAAQYEQIFIDEMRHLSLLGNAIIKLGGDPVYAVMPRGFWTASFVTYSSEPCRMLLDDIAAETAGIKGYKAMLPQLGDTPLAALIQRIIMDEERHLATFKAMYAELAG